MIQSLILFVHITGVLTMFAGLALEAFEVQPTGRATLRVFGLAVPLTLLSGLYMGARFGVLGDAWMCASYGGIVVMAATGPLARRSDALRQLSLRARAAFGLAIVFLMVAKPKAAVSLMVLGLALVISILVGLPTPAQQPRHARRGADRFRAVHRRNATAVQTASTMPNGHVPARNPYADDAAHAIANSRMNARDRSSSA